MHGLFKTVGDIQYLDGEEKDVLGEGSFAQVRLVKHKNVPDKHFALKRVTKRNNQYFSLTYREIEIHSSLKHPFIIELIDVIEDPLQILVILEYAKFGDLFNYARKANLTQDVFLRIYFQTCLAIKYIHDKKIMHRDLKPENILLDHNLNAKLCDFGWSAEFKEGALRETLCGTYEYMAPEVILRGN